MMIHFTGVCKVHVSIDFIPDYEHYNIIIVHEENNNNILCSGINGKQMILHCLLIILLLNSKAYVLIKSVV